MDGSGSKLSGSLSTMAMAACTITAAARAVAILAALLDASGSIGSSPAASVPVRNAAFATLLDASGTIGSSPVASVPVRNAAFAAIPCGLSHAVLCAGVRAAIPCGLSHAVLCAGVRATIAMLLYASGSAVAHAGITIAMLLDASGLPAAVSCPIAAACIVLPAARAIAAVYH